MLNPTPHEIARCYLHSAVFLEVGMGLSVQGFFSSVPSFVYMRWLKCYFLLWFYHFHDCGSLYLLATSPCHTSKSIRGNTFFFLLFFFGCLKDWIFIICLWVLVCGAFVKVGKKMLVPLTASLYVNGTLCSNGVLLILVLDILLLVFYDNRK